MKRKIKFGAALLLLCLAGCSMEQVSGNLVLPTGEIVPYAAKTVHTSAFNSEVIMATKAPKGVDVDVKTGTSVGSGLIQSSTAVANGMTFGMATYGALK